MKKENMKKRNEEIGFYLFIFGISQVFIIVTMTKPQTSWPTILIPTFMLAVSQYFYHKEEKK